MKSIDFIALLAIYLSTACAASTSSAGNGTSWETECVGRYQIILPSKINVPLDKLSSVGISRIPSFPDGQLAQFSHLNYYGLLSIVSPVTEGEFVAYKSVISKRREERRKVYLNSNSEREQYFGKQMRNLSFDKPNKFGWDIEDLNPRIYTLLDSKIFLYSLSNGDNETLRKKQFNSVLNDLHPRPLYDIPNQPGVCIPYGFIADDGDASSDIAVTMRLIDHPDVEILFEDGAPARDPKMAITLFFDGYVNGEKGIKADFWGYRSITMAGQKGKALFVTIKRTDNTKDYGYVAYVEGDSTASSKMLYVISTSSRAKGTPVSKDELKDMAEKIMASVKPHAVQ